MIYPERLERVERNLIYTKHLFSQISHGKMVAVGAV